MLSTQSLLQGYTLPEHKRTRRTERGDLIDMFVNQINPARVEFGLKPLPFSFFSRFFAERQMTVSQLYEFYRDCERANNFSSYFWWATKKHE